MSNQLTKEDNNLLKENTPLKNKPMEAAIEQCQKIDRHEEINSVKSKAIVKFSTKQLPSKFNRLEYNTNLNLAPSNWLTSSGPNIQLHQSLFQTAAFGSFRLGHTFPDCVGAVDVVSEAENIKRLLKLPYTAKSAISMIVHKVGNTLLLDEFDIQKYLLSQKDDEFIWLRRFILDKILSYREEGNDFPLQDKSLEAMRRKTLLSKFLYYSLQQSKKYDSDSDEETLNVISRPALPATAPVLPEPKIDANLPDPKSSHTFTRNVEWTFEDIHMLIGTDIPIFGGPTRPCISLRLRDMGQPINVLTGIDYWLDNLMCNVPEVLMCYHIDGIVQKYEIIKTEDLPYLEDSQFSPEVVHNVAQNILAFLKANATKAGHTYWLFKGPNDEVVKLYDLTTACNNLNKPVSTEKEEKTLENPFTVPVGMLMYNVARNMKNTASRVSPKKAGNIKALLQNCMKLLPKEEYPQIVTSCHYILSDLNIPAGINPTSPMFDSDGDSDTVSLFDEFDDEEFDDDVDNDSFKENSVNANEDQDDKNEKVYDEDNQMLCNKSIAVQSITEAMKEYPNSERLKRYKRPLSPSPLIAGVEERCRSALKHISEGISCLQFFKTTQERFIKESEERAKIEEKQRILHEEQNPNMAKSSKAIPLPYAKLNTPKNSILLKDDIISDLTSNASPTYKLKTSRKKKNNKSKSDCKKFNNSGEVYLNQNQLKYNQVATNFNLQNFGSWNVHLKLLLLEKAFLTYATLAEYQYTKQKFGLSLKSTHLAFVCQDVILKYMNNVRSQKSCLMGRAGDCLFQMTKQWNNISTYLAEFNIESDIEVILMNELEKDLNHTPELIEPIENLEQILTVSCKCYENAIKLLDSASKEEDPVNDLLRRLGNARNELGLKYMYWAQEEYTKQMGNKDTLVSPTISEISNDSTLLYKDLMMKSYDSLTKGIDAFSKVKDDVNLAFLYCNMGRFLRLRAHLRFPNETDVLVQLKYFYTEAFIYYEKAMDILVERKSNPKLWDIIYWEFSTATFILANKCQDFSTVDYLLPNAGKPTTESIEKSEKQVLDALHKALKLSEMAFTGSRHMQYVYRSGILHRRIASYHHFEIKRNYFNGKQPLKVLIQLCNHHYDRSATILEKINASSEILGVQLEWISLYELLTEKSTHIQQKLKNLQYVLFIILNSKGLFYKNALLNRTNVDPDFCNKLTDISAIELILLVESRLQTILKNLIKVSMSIKDTNNLGALYKKMYIETLGRQRKKNTTNLSLEELCVYMRQLIEKLKLIIE